MFIRANKCNIPYCFFHLCLWKLGSDIVVCKITRQNEAVCFNEFGHYFASTWTQLWNLDIFFHDMHLYHMHVQAWEFKQFYFFGSNFHSVLFIFQPILGLGCSCAFFFFSFVLEDSFSCLHVHVILHVYICNSNWISIPTMFLSPIFFNFQPFQMRRMSGSQTFMNGTFW